MDKAESDRWSLRHWWPLALGPLAILCVYGAHHVGWTSIIAKPPHEALALVLIFSASLAFAARALHGDGPAYTILGVLATAFACREVHWAWTHKGVYVAVLGVFVWALCWRERLLPNVMAGRFLPWLVSTGFVYVLSVLVARRAFRGILPLEPELHVALEETLENVAHAMLLLTAFSDRFGRSPRSAPATPVPQESRAH
jgi:hypothetical protein